MRSSNTGKSNMGTSAKGGSAMIHLFKTIGLAALVGATVIVAMATGVFADENGAPDESASVLEPPAPLGDEANPLGEELDRGRELLELEAMRQLCNSPELDLIAFLCAPNAEDEDGSSGGAFGGSLGSPSRRDPGDVVADRVCGDHRPDGPSAPIEEWAANQQTQSVSNEHGRAEVTWTWDDDSETVSLSINRRDGSSVVIIAEYGEPKDGAPTVHRVSYGEADRRGRTTHEYEYGNPEGGSVDEAFGPIAEDIDRIAQELEEKYPTIVPNRGPEEDTDEDAEEDPVIDPYGTPGDSSEFCNLREEIERDRAQARCMFLDPECDPSVENSTDSNCDDPVEDGRSPAPSDELDCSEEPERTSSCESAEAAPDAARECAGDVVDESCANDDTPHPNLDCPGQSIGPDIGVEFNETLPVPLCDEAICDPALSDGLTDDLAQDLMMEEEGSKGPTDGVVQDVISEESEGLGDGPAQDVITEGSEGLTDGLAEDLITESIVDITFETP